MRKLTILMVVIALLTCAVVVTVPALCANGGANGNSCDLVTLLRGTARVDRFHRVLAHLARGGVVALEPDLLGGGVLVGEDEPDVGPLAEEFLDAAVTDIVIGADDDFVVFHRKLRQLASNHFIVSFFDFIQRMSIFRQVKEAEHPRGGVAALRRTKGSGG